MMKLSFVLVNILLVLNLYSQSVSAFAFGGENSTLRPLNPIQGILVLIGACLLILFICGYCCGCTFGIITDCEQSRKDRIKRKQEEEEENMEAGIV
eukprot:TRINITY_DN10858_c0_g2_i1.p1 TRINITY_DN10858_c0_g2~~TRINITY_DN10858_c0_g2_i1.p1  ORF type:complete len:96 (+),score=10.50 TRINITY_DN10858_c0_g2_i1:3-290(+)